MHVTHNLNFIILYAKCRDIYLADFQIGAYRYTIKFVLHYTLSIKGSSHFMVLIMDTLRQFSYPIVFAFIPKLTIGAPILEGTYSEHPSAPGFQDDYEDDMDMAMLFFSMAFMLLSYILLTLIYFSVRFVIKKYFSTRISLNNNNSPNFRITTSNSWPSSLDDEEAVKDKLVKLSPEEQFYYKQGEEYIKQNPPLLIPHRPEDSQGMLDPIINEQTIRFIEEEGVHAWEFQPDPNLPNDTILIENKTEITFLNYNYDASVMTNLPVPRVNRVYYFECKIFELNTSRSDNNYLSDNEMISFGLSSSPYPYFRLPGRHHHSIAYDSTGGRRFNDSFELSAELASIFPRYQKGDIIGIGYRTNSGTVFFTRNGKKLNEKPIDGHIKGWKLKYLYPIVGANVPCKVHVNFGSYGFVFIEANVKKWGYAKSHGVKLPPPSYDEYGQDVLLESSYEDDITDNESVSTVEGDIVDSDGELLPPPPGFEFSTTPQSRGDIGDQITLDSLPAQPPSYSSDDDIRGEHEENVDEEETAQQLQQIVEERGEDEMNFDMQSSPVDGNNLNDNTVANQFIHE